MADESAVRTEKAIDPETARSGGTVTDLETPPVAETREETRTGASTAAGFVDAIETPSATSESGLDPASTADPMGARSRWAPSAGLRLWVPLAVVAAAVAATMLQAGPAVQVPLWVAAAVGVALVFRTEALDLLTRSLGLGAVAVILLGPLLQAFGIKLWHDAWALGVGALAVAAIVVGHLRSRAGHPWPGHAAGDPRRDPAPVNRRSLVWGGLAALTVLGALAGASLSGRIDAPEAELWLVNPAEVQAAAPAQPGAGQVPAGAPAQPAAAAPTPAAPTQVQVAVRAAQAIPDARLIVTTLGPFVAVPYAPTPTGAGAAKGTAAGPAGGAPTFALAAGETVQRSVTIPATGRTEIRLTSASRPDLDRTLVLNR